MKLRFTIARLTKREQRCDDVTALSGEAKYAGVCPGWRVVDMASKKGVRLIACAACNELQPVRLRVEDADVKLIPEARSSAIQRRAQLHEAQQARRTTIHLRDDAATMRVLCGHSLGRTSRGRRTHRWSFRPAEATCDECLRLNSLTPSQRAAETVACGEALRARFAHKRADELLQKAKDHARRAELIAEGRPDAMVALDLVQAGSVLDEDKSALITRSLTLAITAYKHDHPKSRGDRLWVLSDIKRGLGNQRCRFCRDRLRDVVRVGADTSLAGMTTDVAEHTTRCALRYLAGEYLPPERDLTMLELVEEIEEARAG